MGVVQPEWAELSLTKEGTLTIRDSTFKANLAVGGIGGSGHGGAGMGGALFNHSGTVTIINSTFSGNTAQGGQNGSGLGGAIFNYNGLMSMTNSTLADNFVYTGGAAGGGIYNYKDGATSNLTLHNTILANTQGNSSNDCTNTNGTGGHW
ncbi:MAG: hypothetical protein AAF485_02800 [Chloroflexota bacterium]